jgi:RNase H-fold protein (predicted Holliday junction resolvase)
VGALHKYDERDTVEITRLTDAVDLTVEQIDERLASIKAEKALLKQAKAALQPFKG